ncbi:glycosyltransferase [Chryseobacterium sp. JUb7]|uniref:glycosyltransferase n=1 Tax=Chryseobacterium sp. JUb7 TaxID=2940599 RepID=UPI002167BC58|nr:glycosyltransferase [Chryseobacterium sp. JUb7]MCS3531761.1 glycosyltransferase involved in cell wall biosynthesis [Chryseobacterium sp. JUb7]
MKNTGVSICMAVYNGDKYIEGQLISILNQLNDNDEIIVVNDFSKDKTIEIIEAFKDSRIKIFHNEKNMGHVKSFERAIDLSKNELIFLSDQDDLWMPNKIKIFKEYFEKQNVQLVSSSFTCFDNDYNTNNDEKYKLYQNESAKYSENIIRIFKGNIPYFGCAMGFKREFLKIILPFPEYVEAHDLWIGMAANILKSNLHIEENSILHRIHNANATPSKRPLSKKIKSRLVFIKSYLELRKRTKYFDIFKT